MNFQKEAPVRAATAISQPSETDARMYETALLELRSTMEMVPHVDGEPVIQVHQASIDQRSLCVQFRTFGYPQVWTDLLTNLLKKEPNGCRVKFCRRYFNVEGRGLVYLWEVTLVSDNIAAGVQGFREHMAEAIAMTNSWTRPPEQTQPTAARTVPGAPRPIPGAVGEQARRGAFNTPNLPPRGRERQGKLPKGADGTGFTVPMAQPEAATFDPRGQGGARGLPSSGRPARR